MESCSEVFPSSAKDLDDLEDTTADGVSTQAEYESLDNWRFNQEPSAGLGWCFRKGVECMSRQSGDKKCMNR